MNSIDEALLFVIAVLFVIILFLILVPLVVPILMK